MDKEEALNEFLKGLRIILNNASVYSKEHPYFVKSAENFKEKLDLLFNYLEPVKINITPGSLLIDGKSLDKSSIHVELAQAFHYRKIKSLEFRRGLALAELIDFISAVALPRRDIIRRGGIKNILNKQTGEHITVDELDYSLFLGEKGEEAKDIWVYLFHQAISEEDKAKLDELAKNFEQVISKIKISDLVDDEELRESLLNFLAYLRNNKVDQYHGCSQTLVRAILKSRGLTDKDKLGKLKGFFENLGKEDFADALWEGIKSDEDFNAVGFTVFSELLSDEQHGQIAPLLEERIKVAESRHVNLKARRKIRDLFSGVQDSAIIPLYQRALAWLLDSKKFESSLNFDEDLIKMNFRYLLLNLLNEKKNDTGLNDILEMLAHESGQVFAEKDWDYVKSLLAVLDKKRYELNIPEELVERIQGPVLNFVENAVFSGISPDAIGEAADKLKKSSLGKDFYLDKIFKEGKVNHQVLKLYLRFFPDGLQDIYEQLQKRHVDIDFLASFVTALEKIDSSLVPQVLEKIFWISNTVVRIEVLKTMQNLPGCDDLFLLAILKEDNFLLKKEALAILAKNDASRGKAAEGLLSVNTLWGLKNNILMENISLVEEMGLKEALPYLEEISKRPFFWNAALRKKASELLGKWHDR